MSDDKIYKYEDILEKDGILVFTNKGVSMMPLLREGRDLMVIEKRGEQRLKKYDAVLYKSHGRYVLHRILKVRPDDYVICGDNCIRREYGVRDGQILGVLKAVVRDGKRTINVTDRNYLVYVHLWCDFYHIRAALLFCRKACAYIFRKLIKKSFRKGEQNEDK